jgi:D-alanine transaminase
VSTIYLNGEYVPAASATVSIDDRGFLFADACYEVTACFGGRLLALDRHLVRLQRGLDELRIEFDVESLVPVHEELIVRNGLVDVTAGSVYVHVTRGVAPRDHAFPAAATPTVLARTRSTPTRPETATAGTRAITHPDIRWGRVDIKTTSLLPNVLAQQWAVDAGVGDVILHRDGVVTEGSHTNVLGVIDGVLVTAPADHRILPGITRGLVLELAVADGIDVAERTWTLDELFAADEVFMTSTNSGVRPIVEIDGRPVASGRRGPVTERLQALYGAFVARECGT